MNTLALILLFSIFSYAGEDGSVSGRTLTLAPELNDRINQTCWEKANEESQMACYAYLIIDWTRSEHGLPQIDELSQQISILTQQVERSGMGSAQTFIPGVLQKIGFIFTDLKRLSDPAQTESEYLQNLESLDESLRMLRVSAGL